MPPFDWHAAFVPTIHPLEIVMRGTLIYLFLFVIFRVLRRDAGTISLGDLLVVTLIADASQNAMASEYKSISEGVILISTIVGWNYLLDTLAYRFPRLRRWLEPPLRDLIRDGQLLRQNLRKEMISVEDLMSQLREHGVDDVASVKRCSLESDGKISVIEKT
jgi:uncharacterized membrane protein YcaP (DUF421 family)